MFHIRKNIFVSGGNILKCDRKLVSLNIFVKEKNIWIKITVIDIFGKFMFVCYDT